MNFVDRLSCRRHDGFLKECPVTRDHCIVDHPSFPHHIQYFSHVQDLRKKLKESVRKLAESSDARGRLRRNKPGRSRSRGIARSLDRRTYRTVRSVMHRDYSGGRANFSYKRFSEARTIPARLSLRSHISDLGTHANGSFCRMPHKRSSSSTPYSPTQAHTRQIRISRVVQLSRSLHRSSPRSCEPARHHRR